MDIVLMKGKLSAQKVILFAKDIQNSQNTRNIYVVAQIGDAVLTLFNLMVNGDHA